eukprot:scaffold1446_cov391-Prasinococcus_capsulatus_cf.AAC.31
MREGVAANPVRRHLTQAKAKASYAAGAPAVAAIRTARCHGARGRSSGSPASFHWSACQCAASPMQIKRARSGHTAGGGASRRVWLG